MHVTGLPPIIPERCTLLVLGSLPGNRSLHLGQYYAHPMNQFWRLMEQVIGSPLAQLAYAERLSRLAERRIGLWDVIARAERRSSLDSDIAHAVANPLKAMLQRLPDLRTIGCNGALAGRIARRELEPADVPIVQLPSSSPAHTLAFSAKADAWRQLGEFLGR